jgi:hypothetical protein
MDRRQPSAFLSAEKNMPAEAVRYIDGKPAVADGLQVDVITLLCGKCQAEYRIHYSQVEARRLDDHRYFAGERITAEHPAHSRNIWI